MFLKYGQYGDPHMRFVCLRPSDQDIDYLEIIFAIKNTLLPRVQLAWAVSEQDVDLKGPRLLPLHAITFIKAGINKDRWYSPFSSDEGKDPELELNIKAPTLRPLKITASDIDTANTWRTFLTLVIADLQRADAAADDCEHILHE
jgi:hypothetical protein